MIPGQPGPPVRTRSHEPFQGIFASLFAQQDSTRYYRYDLMVEMTILQCTHCNFELAGDARQDRRAREEQVLTARLKSVSPVVILEDIRWVKRYRLNAKCVSSSSGWGLANVIIISSIMCHTLTSLLRSS